MSGDARGRAISPAVAGGDQSRRARRKLYGPARNDKRLRSRCSGRYRVARSLEISPFSRRRLQRGPCATMRDALYLHSRSATRAGVAGPVGFVVLLLVVVVVVGNRFIPSCEMNEIVRRYEHADAAPDRLSVPDIGARSSAIMRRVTRCALHVRGNRRRLTHPVSRICSAHRDVRRTVR